LYMTSDRDMHVCIERHQTETCMCNTRETPYQRRYQRHRQRYVCTHRDNQIRKSYRLTKLKHNPVNSHRTEKILHQIDMHAQRQTVDRR
jgi:hypothetical protein